MFAYGLPARLKWPRCWFGTEPPLRPYARRRSSNPAQHTVHAAEAFKCAPASSFAGTPIAVALTSEAAIISRTCCAVIMVELILFAVREALGALVGSTQSSRHEGGIKETSRLPGLEASRHSGRTSAAGLSKTRSCFRVRTTDRRFSSYRAWHHPRQCRCADRQGPALPPGQFLQRDPGSRWKGRKTARAVMIEGEQPFFGERRQELVGEERIAAGLLVHQLRQRRGTLGSRSIRTIPMRCSSTAPASAGVSTTA